MEYRIISLPPFTAVTSGVDKHFDFSENGILGKFGRWFATVTPSPRDGFMPRDFLFFNKEAGGLEWWWAMAEGMPDGGHEKAAFDGGLYLTYIYKDGDNAENERLYQEAVRYIKDSAVFSLDERPAHYAMGHIITPQAVIDAQGYGVMEAFVPIKLK